jgi:predicted Zn-ribbon and HTH transcriptional regulator
MTCRVARSYRHFVQMEPVPCSECGSTYMDVRVASRTLEPHLCPICAQSLSPRVMSSTHASCVPMRHQQVA